MNRNNETALLEQKIAKSMLWSRPCTLVDIKRAGVRAPLQTIQELKKAGYWVQRIEVDVFAADGSKHFALMYTFVYEQAQPILLLA
jgi:hypothetical protein